MLKFVRSGAAAPETPPADIAGWAFPPDTSWIDLISPTLEEERLVERCLGAAIPTRDEMRELEPSSRFYREGGATFMTATVLANADADFPTSEPVTFILTGAHLVTVRYIEPRAFALFYQHLAHRRDLCLDGATTFLGLLDTLVERASLVLDRTATEVDVLARGVFDPSPTDFNKALAQLGRAQTINAGIRESLVSVARLGGYAGLAEQVASSEPLKARLAEVSRDIQFLLDQAGFETGNVGFLLDATLGLIGNRQNGIMQVFSVASVVFLPPTLIASIYGMNFEWMPELKQPLGYPVALLAMLASAVGPYLWFRKKGWL